MCSVSFLAGMLTKSRGNNRGNIIAMIIGFVVVAILSGLPNNIAGMFGTKLLTHSRVWLASDGISLVDLLRNNRHVFCGDFVSDWPRASPRCGLAAILKQELTDRYH